MSEGFEPKIVVFACNWCTYAAVDLAGTSRIQYPHNVRVIRVMCSGRVDPQFVLEAFNRGADGVIVAGCHPPADCHYSEGNFKAFRRFTLFRRLLDSLGIERERFKLEWISASEAGKWVQVVNEMVNDLKKLGPLREKLEVR
ncbi:MAG: methyl-viologen-reducing hydrogenase subunit delta [Thermoproteota archaeon]|jgi:F420-non-reducing hydrogenase iron-sulfur subunit|uniref:Hydrogenase iron-sulfur subunit n=1 Tax=Candidatus Methanodesulfokora washburnensis TaxID=2478471 RepID=A0A429GDE7_9CREN|nr:hydrogenase iron-sulfur subunit [Candidatus Methanodesulfokores washburnensis]RSN71839.1 hydrogenase iron-sulfur subunit [Candidatus Methanodesulfokores washburnensis]RZN58977.1 MAG: hydrogenase iron-sulfur subunit [Candidatus Methanodesulfokores washburnensis]TDA41445.1 MAG: methyl-viologen-reducing hydrogenase subunit delta [Candidatus Korarchaeota archaeon]